MYAIVDIAGQQFKVEKDQKLFVHRLEGEEGKKVSFDRVLLIDTGNKISVGDPVVKGAAVSARILTHMKGDKVLVFKKKRRKGYKKLNGHRQYLTQIQIEGISEKGQPGAKPAEQKTEAKPAAKTAVKSTAKSTPEKKATPAKTASTKSAATKSTATKSTATKSTATKSATAKPATSKAAASKAAASKAAAPKKGTTGKTGTGKDASKDKDSGKEGGK